MQIDNYHVTIKIDDRGEFGRYGKVFTKNLYECDAKFYHILTLAPGMKLQKICFIPHLKWQVYNTCLPSYGESP